MNNTSPEHKELLKEVSRSFMQVIHGFGYFFGRVKPKDATLLQIQVLSLLRTRHVITAKGIGQSLYLSSSATAQLLQRMFDAGWLKRSPSQTDRRIVQLSLTDKGNAAIQEYAKTISAGAFTFYSVLTDEELTSFLSILDKLHHKMQEVKNNGK